jgi:hypothetical protein
MVPDPGSAPWPFGIEGSIFYVNMLSAESSLSRYPEWKTYKARSGMVFPKLLEANPGQQLRVE